QHLHGSEFRIDRDLRQVRPKAEHGVRYTLAVFIERAGRRIERGFRGRNVSELVKRKLREMNRLLTAALLHFQAMITKPDCRVLTRKGQLQNRCAQFFSRHRRGLAGYKGLARRRGLSAIRRDGGVSGNEIKALDGSLHRVRANLSHDRVRSLSNINRALMQRDPSIGLQSNTHRGWMGMGSVAAA